jgi:type I restriction enzyme S subunit
MPHYENMPFELPKGWVWCKLEDIAYVASGSTPSKECFIEKGVPYLKMFNLRRQKIDFEFHPQYIMKETHEGRLARSIAKPGDLIMNIVGPPLGKLAIIPPELTECNFNQAAVMIRPYLYTEIINMYLFYYLSEMSEINSISTKGSAGQVNISLTQSQNMRIPLPPLEEQKIVIKEIKKRFNILDIIESNENDIKNLTIQLKSKILELAIHGKLVFQDESDEPAIELLRRISPNFTPSDISHYENMLPQNWIIVKLGEIFDHNTGKALNRTSHEGKLLEYITTSNLYWDHFELDNLKAMYFKDGEIDKCTVQKGDLLVCEGGDIGRAAIWDREENILIQNHIHKLRPKFEFCVSLYYYVLMLYKRLDMIGGKGIAIQGLSSRELHNLLVPFPPVNEQKRIVNKIESIFNSLDLITRELTD